MYSKTHTNQDMMYDDMCKYVAFANMLPLYPLKLHWVKIKIWIIHPFSNHGEILFHDFCYYGTNKSISVEC